jgi:hypothetical protein
MIAAAAAAPPEQGFGIEGILEHRRASCLTALLASASGPSNARRMPRASDAEG